MIRPLGTYAQASPAVVEVPDNIGHNHDMTLKVGIAALLLSLFCMSTSILLTEICMFAVECRYEFGLINICLKAGSEWQSISWVTLR